MIKIVIIINDQKFFQTHRSYYYKFDNSFSLKVLTFKKIKKKRIKNIIFESLNIKNIFKIKILKILNKFNESIKLSNADIIHVYGIVPIFMFIISNFFSKKKAILTFTGMGYISVSKKLYYKVIFYIIKLILKYSSNNNNFHYNFQNNEQNFLQKPNFIFYSTCLSKKEFNTRKNLQKKNPNKILFAGRLIKSKGVLEILKLAKNNIKLKFFIAGKLDFNHPDSISPKEYKQLMNIKNVSFLGEVNNLRNNFNKYDFLIFLSKYGEGIPRIILEAGSNKIPILSINGSSIPKELEKYVTFIDKFNFDEIVKNDLYYNFKKKTNQFYEYLIKNYYEDAIVRKNMNIYKKLYKNLNL